MLFQNNLPQKILIINIFGIGDVLFTTPPIAALKAQYPNVSIGYLCNRRTVSVVENNPKIDHVFVYERDEFKRLSKFAALKKTFEFIKTIKAQGYDASVDFSLSDFTGWLTWMAGIKNRIGFQYKGRGFFLNYKFQLRGYDDKHVVEYYLELLEKMGVPTAEKKLELNVSTADHQWADAFIQENISGSFKKGAIGLVPGGGASWGEDAKYKRWAVEKYAKLADNLIEKFTLPIILMGSESELDLCQNVAGLMGNSVSIACGKTSIGQFAALALKCAVVIVNDGGPLHIAVAAGAQTVSIFGPVNEKVYGPYPKEGQKVVTNELACRPCYRRFRRAACDHITCLAGLTVEEVFKQIVPILDKC